MAGMDSCTDLVLCSDSPASEALGMPREALYSPLSSGMGSTGSVQNSNESNNSNSYDDGHIYEDINISSITNNLPGPPKITPISGVLGKGKIVIRPIAFKPVSSSNSYTPLTCSGSHTPSSCGHSSSRMCLHYGGCLSEPDLKRSAQSPYNYLHNAFLAETDSRSATYSTNESCLKFMSETPASYVSSTNPAQGSIHLEEFTQTPSPSDSGVAELEAMLREKDSEISYLRETMEHNEQVIFKVYEEKEHSWQRELKNMKAHYEARLKACQQKALMQTYQLQQEKRKLKQENEELKGDKELIEHQLKALHMELEVERSQLEETEWAMCQKTGEIALLKLQLKDCHGDHSSRTNELLSLKAQLRDTQIEMEKKEEETYRLLEELEHLREHAKCKARTKMNSSLQNLHCQEKDFKNVGEPHSDLLVNELKHQVECLQMELKNTRVELQSQRDVFKEEKLQWLKEKDKVIQYQKQLQANYVQMFRRNETLSTKLEHLTLELENRDSKIHGSESNC